MDRNSRHKGSGGEWRLRLARAAAHLRADLSFAVIDAFLIVMAYSTALGLRFVESEAGVPGRWLGSSLRFLPVIVGVHLLCNVAFGTYGHVWEYASVAEAVRMVLAAASAGLVVLLMVILGRQLFSPVGPVPAGVVVMGSMLTLAGMGAVRFRSRMFSFKRLQRPPSTQRSLVVGTGRAAADMARHASQADSPIVVAGFVSVNGQQPRLLAGLPVLGTLDEIKTLVDQHQVDQIIVAGLLDDRMLRELVDRCMSIDVRLRILPDMERAINGDGHLRDLRDLELTDLLPRPEVTTDLVGAASVLGGRRILVTGAGGSIGSEIVRQVLALDPFEVVALDNDETHLYEAAMAWRDPRVIPVLADVREPETIERIFAVHRPQVVFHAAAHKHVPILEESPAEAVKTNVFGTQSVLDATRGVGVEQFVLISTDKATSASSVMGASKRVAEMLMRSASLRDQACRYSAVRFGNVLGSRGSVVPTFLKQIQQGGPVTVTDPEMVRYFMTVDEAVQLVLQAAALTEHGETFVLDMGEPVRIGDLAHRLIRLAGLVPGRDIEVEVIGARPGERMKESLSENGLKPAKHPKVHIADSPHPGNVTLLDALHVLRHQIEAGSDTEVRETLLGLAHGGWSEPETIDLNLSEEAAQWS